METHTQLDVEAEYGREVLLEVFEPRQSVEMSGPALQHL